MVSKLHKLKCCRIRCYLVFVSLGFEDLTRAYSKALPVITKEDNGVTPKFYLHCLVELEDFINEVWEDREGR